MTELIMFLLNTINAWLAPILIVLLLVAGAYFTLRMGFVQLRMVGESLRIVREKPKNDQRVSSFQALMVSTASRVGTGNIVGISNAIIMGGAGAVFWMWVIALIGSASAVVESTLAQIYKRRDAQGNSYGGPAYYIESALKSRALAVTFAVSLILTYAGGFNMLTSYNLQTSFSAYAFYDTTTTPWVIGAVLAVAVGWCLMGGGKRILKATSTLVPLMGVAYMVISIVVIGVHWKLIPAVFAQIFAEAFDFQAIFGGFTGSCLMYGIKRGLYSNEAGVGSAPNAAAAAEVSHPAKQGLVQMLSVFLDTLVLCTTTALLCLCSGVIPLEDMEGAPFVQQAIGTVFGDWGTIFLTLALVMFAFTTLLGNLYYVDNCLAFIHKKQPSKAFMNGFRVVSVGIVFVGAGLSANAVWTISEILMTVMCLINLPACLVLSKTAFACVRDYEKQRKVGENPVFHAQNIGLEAQKLEYWQ